MSVEKRWQDRVGHILRAINSIQAYTAGMTEEAFAADSKTVDAVLRNFQVLGEAARHIPDAVQERYAEVPWALMQGMRHVVVHDYFAVKVDIVWRTIHVNLPPLIEPLQRILRDNP
jgi:uncharacterized protein with HEPN domain